MNAEGVGREAPPAGIPPAWLSAMRSRVVDRRFVVIGPLARAARLGVELRNLGATDVHLVGYGDIPSTYRGTYSIIERPPGGLPELTRTTLRDLPADVRAALDVFDPRRDASVLGFGSFESPRLADRSYVGTRQREWRALEDKTTVDALWDRIGVQRPPSEVVAATRTDLQMAAERLDLGMGTVWSGDASAGESSGGDLVRHVRNGDQAATANALMEGACRRVRVAPFLDGVPCSIHALVTGDGAAVFRPVEIVMLRQPRGRFLYAGTATWWDPGPGGRTQMRDVARRTAEHLSTSLAYRGAFGIDGIFTPNGFLPTELNARWAAGFYSVVGPTGNDRMMLLEAFIAEGLKGPVEALEEVVVSAADRRRWGGPTLSGQTALREGRVLLDASGGKTTAEDEAVAAIRVAGPLEAAEITVRPRPRLFVGRSVADLGVRGFAVADRLLGTDVGPVESWETPFSSSVL